MCVDELSILCCRRRLHIQMRFTILSLHNIMSLKLLYMAEKDRRHRLQPSLCHSRGTRQPLYSVPVYSGTSFPDLCQVGFGIYVLVLLTYMIRTGIWISLILSNYVLVQKTAFKAEATICFLQILHVHI